MYGMIRFVFRVQVWPLGRASLHNRDVTKRVGCQLFVLVERTWDLLVPRYNSYCYCVGSVMGVRRCKAQGYCL